MQVEESSRKGRFLFLFAYECFLCLCVKFTRQEGGAPWTLVLSAPLAGDSQADWIQGAFSWCWLHRKLEIRRFRVLLHLETIVISSTPVNISCFKKIYHIFPKRGKNQVISKCFPGFSLWYCILFFRHHFERRQLDLHFCLCLMYLVILCSGCGKPKLKLICCWKGRISQKPPKGLLGPRQLLIPHFENCLLNYPKVSKSQRLRRSAPRSQRLTKGQICFPFAWHLSWVPLE